MELVEQIGTNGTFRAKWNYWNNTERMEQNGKLEQMEFLEQTE